MCIKANRVYFLKVYKDEYEKMSTKHVPSRKSRQPQNAVKEIWLIRDKEKFILRDLSATET